MTERILKVNEVIRAELAQIILKEMEFPQGFLVTLTRVETSKDLRLAKAFISIMPNPDETIKKQIWLALEKEIGEIQHQLNKRLNMRPMPKIRLVEETKTAQAARIEELLKNS